MAASVRAGSSGGTRTGLPFRPLREREPIMRNTGSLNIYFLAFKLWCVCVSTLFLFVPNLLLLLFLTYVAHEVIHP